jgi:hypothetical protein
MLPPHVQFNAVTSTLGWQCESSAANPQCRFPLYTQTGQNSMSGRIFFGVLVGGLLPTEVTQLEFTATLAIDGAAGSQTQQLVLPVLPADATPPPPGDLTLDLSSKPSELLMGRDHALSYSFTYTNTSPAVLEELDFHLMLPSVGIVHPAEVAQLDWLCSPEGDEQQVCSFSVAALEPGAKRQAPFTLELAQSSRLKGMRALVTAAYAVRKGQTLSSDVVVVPIQQGLDDRFPVFLPLIAKQGA